MHQTRRLSIALIVTLISPQAFAADAPKVDVPKLTNQPDAWFTSDEGRHVLDDIVSWQNPNGGWWKAYNADTTRPVVVEEKPGIKGDDDNVWHKTSTIDNAATYSEIAILARAYRVTKDERFKTAFDRGLSYLLEMQYPNGGWPQRYPLQPNYGSHITYNDDAMINVMLLLREISVTKSPDYALVDDATRAKVAAALDRGIECVLNTQIKVDGKPTVWCQQHDEKTLAPADARAYELPSFCSSESAAIVNFLMDMPKPSGRIKASVDGAVAWFETHKIENKKVEKLTGPQYEGGREVKIVDAPGSTIWARFYDLDTGKPYVCDRDGIKRESIEQLGHERRVGYAWYNVRPAKTIERYAKWKAENGG